MEIRQLRTLIALVESQFNMSRAAEKLNLVQSALSQQLNRLENELGAKLFIRKGKRLKSLTTVGEDVFKQAKIEGGTISWSNGADIAPETLYEKIKG